MKQKHLVAALQQVRTWEEPRADLEQYPTPPEIACSMLFAADANGDLLDATVADLGCGGGILGIGAALLGSSHVLAVDLDPEAIRVAAENVRRLEVPVDLLNADVTHAAQ